eukprot:CAMPEP_0183470746 /NCGR_PEP_ID=MMETSP0370-20130417/156779_1 /TAXON_ID=268820 /ORGANISM="Peridinium aciculiferum, Strain PAER-2" /LENGTH=81 /DNA_ID=CAMNT_0025663287 /DNA_START=18 /DNA_END=259 /DNA_ORIENTATION=-
MDGMEEESLGAGSDLSSFQAEWGLDDRCMEYLAKLPAHVQEKVTVGFTHRPDQTNPSARCISFAKKIAEAHGGGSGGGSGG